MNVAFSLSFAALLSGCSAFGGDMPIRVKGSIPDDQVTGEPAQCTLVLLSAKSERERSRRSISHEFQVSFVVEAQPELYRFVARCDDGRKYRSKEYEIGGKGTFNILIDLGVLRTAGPSGSSLP